MSAVQWELDMSTEQWELDMSTVWWELNMSRHGRHLSHSPIWKGDLKIFSFQKRDFSI